MSISADNSSLLDLQTGNQVTCKIHPTVIFAILDHYVRRNDAQNRVIGTLLGVENDGVIEIKSSFPELHSESQEVRYWPTIFSLLQNWDLMFYL